MSEQQKPSVCRVVMHRTQKKHLQHNCLSDHPAIITRVWGGGTLVNLQVLPDCGPVRVESSQRQINPNDPRGEGWYWPARS